jgi:hypothetical protein
MMLSPWHSARAATATARPMTGHFMTWPLPVAYNTRRNVMPTARFGRTTPATAQLDYQHGMGAGQDEAASKNAVHDTTKTTLDISFILPFFLELLVLSNNNGRCMEFFWHDTLGWVCILGDTKTGGVRGIWRIGRKTTGVHAFRVDMFHGKRFTRAGRDNG